MRSSWAPTISPQWLNPKDYISAPYKYCVIPLIITYYPAFGMSVEKFVMMTRTFGEFVRKLMKGVDK